MKTILCFFGWHEWSYKVIQFNNRCKPIGEIYPWAKCKHCDSCYGTKQKTFVFCTCNNELTSTNSFVKDTDLVYYKCSECGEESRWDFDAPCPIKINF